MEDPFKRSRSLLTMMITRSKRRKARRIKADKSEAYMSDCLTLHTGPSQAKAVLGTVR